MPFFRKVDEEFEAPLAAPAGGSPSPEASGKSERKRYGDGEERLKVKARNLDLPDGTPVEVLIRGEVAVEVSVEDGKIRVDFTDSDRPVPAVASGDVIELRADGVVHAAGEYQPD